MNPNDAADAEDTILARMDDPTVAIGQPYGLYGFRRQCANPRPHECVKNTGVAVVLFAAPESRINPNVAAALPSLPGHDVPPGMPADHIRMALPLVGTAEQMAELGKALIEFAGTLHTEQVADIGLGARPAQIPDAIRDLIRRAMEEELNTGKDDDLPGMYL